jgi:hypothetical protein
MIVLDDRTENHHLHIIISHHIRPYLLFWSTHEEIIGVAAKS